MRSTESGLRPCEFQQFAGEDDRHAHERAGQHAEELRDRLLARIAAEQVAGAPGQIVEWLRSGAVRAGLDDRIIAGYERCCSVRNSTFHDTKC
jgi:hypothetical protein